MIFQIHYHEKVIKNDIPKLSSVYKKRMQSAIANKLTLRPDVYGMPMRWPLNKYRKLRVGDYRVVFALRNKKVLILKIQHRSLVYKSFDRYM